MRKIIAVTVLAVCFAGYLSQSGLVEESETAKSVKSSFSCDRWEKAGLKCPSK